MKRAWKNIPTILNTQQQQKFDLRGFRNYATRYV